MESEEKGLGEVGREGGWKQLCSIRWVDINYLGLVVMISTVASRLEGAYMYTGKEKRAVGAVAAERRDVTPVGSVARGGFTYLQSMSHWKERIAATTQLQSPPHDSVFLWYKLHQLPLHRRTDFVFLQFWGKTGACSK